MCFIMFKRYIDMITDFVYQCKLIILLLCMKIYIRVLIMYFSIAEQQWLNYYLRKYEDHDTVIKKIRANKICPYSIETLYEEYYEEYSYYYRKD